jgi:hypothetical protein
VPGFVVEDYAGIETANSDVWKSTIEAKPGALLIATHSNSETPRNLGRDLRQLLHLHSTKVVNGWSRASTRQHRF